MSPQPLEPDAETQKRAEEPEPRIVSPFVIMQRGMGTVDPADSNRLIFEDYSPRVLPSDTPEEEPEMEIPTVPKDLSVQEPVSSSEPSPPQVPQESEPTAPLVMPQPMVPTVQTVPLPKPPVVPEGGKPNPSEAG